MEVFLVGVPGNLSASRLNVELTKQAKAIGLSDDWLCETAKRKNIGWMRFLNQREAEKFLQFYGVENRGSMQIGRLHIQGEQVIAKKSRNEVDDFTRKILNHKHDQRLEEEAESARRRNQGLSSRERDNVTFCHNRFAMGNNMFLDDQLTFVQEWDGAVKDGTVKFGRRTIILRHLDVSSDKQMRIDISFDTVVSATVSMRDRSITLVLCEPPRFYRGANVFDNVKGAEFVRLDSYTPTAPTAYCLAYRISLSDVVSDQEMSKKINLIKADDMLNVIIIHTPLIRPWERPTVVKSWGEELAILDQRINTCSQKNSIPFSILFQIRSLVLGNYIRPGIAVAFLDRLVTAWLSAKTAGRSTKMPFSGESIKKMASLIPFATVDHEPSQFTVDYLFETLLDLERSKREQGSLLESIMAERSGIWVFRATVTPTRVILAGPELEAKNRILRKYQDSTEYFMRVQFGDENGDTLHSGSKMSNDLIYQRFENVASSGINVAGRVYGFLGFSHSSLRSASAWFSAAFVDKNRAFQTYASIIGGLGDFAAIRVPAKCAARIGQNFSETPYAVPLKEHGIALRYMEDVKSADGSRVFSDGVGTISTEAKDLILATLPGRKSDANCFQIRLGSVKGMLSLDATLTGRAIYVRKESMMKFPCADLNELGICDMASKPLRLYLNRQIIKILEDMHVSAWWFTRLQEQELKNLRSVTSTLTRTRKFLDGQSIGSNFGFSRLLRDLELMGIDYRKDAFLRSIVENVVLREVRLLKHKSRIPVYKGATLFGVMDETGYLKENQIFVAFDESHPSTRDFIDKNFYKKRQRTVLVSRSPALHPGDVQVVDSIVPPAGHSLRKLRNCVVFSQNGARDLPSQLSGGDLDGDLYHVIWDPDAIPSNIRSYEPADYPRVKAVELDRDVTKEDMVKHFVGFMKSDQLGIIATKHIIAADQKLSGTPDPDCIKLAELHSTAVDFSKTGLPPDLQVMNKLDIKRFRPDFLAPAPPTFMHDVGQIHFLDVTHQKADDEEGPVRHNYYRSEKILGELYRNVDEQKIWTEDIRIKNAQGGISIWEQLGPEVNQMISNYGDGSISWKRKQDKAWDLRVVFEEDWESHRWQFTPNYRTPLREIEIFSGCIFNKNGAQTKRQKDNSIKLHEESIRSTDWLTRQLRHGGSVNAELTRRDDASYLANRDAIELCWAAWMITSLPKEHWPSKYVGDGRQQTFRVVAVTCLLRELAQLKKAWEELDAYDQLAGLRDKTNMMFDSLITKTSQPVEHLAFMGNNSMPIRVKTAQP